jgi:carbohydrate kinase (thermoresistant glucokinase family)
MKQSAINAVFPMGREEKGHSPIRIVLLMGVSGSGKTMIGRRLAKELDWPFFEGDAFHSRRNVAKMSRGESLNDHDRNPWLTVLRELIQDLTVNEQRAVISCSALKQVYRDRLTAGYPHVAIVYLKGSPSLIHRRLQSRKDHFMKADMLPGQLSELEEPRDALAVNIEQEPEIIVQQIKQALRLTQP